MLDAISGKMKAVRTKGRSLFSTWNLLLANIKLASYGEFLVMKCLSGNKMRLLFLSKVKKYYILIAQRISPEVCAISFLQVLHYNNFTVRDKHLLIWAALLIPITLTGWYAIKASRKSEPDSINSCLQVRKWSYMKSKIKWFQMFNRTALAILSLGQIHWFEISLHRSWADWLHQIWR